MDKLGKFIENKNVFRCPHCGGKLHVNGGGSFVCKKKHCFDISAKGYVNFLTTQGSHKNKYDKDLFECRNKIFKAGFYDLVLETVAQIISDYAPCQEPEAVSADRLTVLDVGCGEGFYASYLSRRDDLQASVFALDIVKEAIQIACREQTDVKWIVGNLADIPLFNKVFDVVLDVLTPANYKEFQRLMKKQGILIKVIPGEDYLKEVRQCVAGQLINKEYSNDSTVAYFKENMSLEEMRQVRYSLPVTPEQAELFLRMTPMTFGVNTDNIEKESLEAIKEITIHLMLLIGRKRSDR